MKKFTYTVDQKPLTLEVNGKVDWGKDEILINKEQNLIEYSTFMDTGYIVTEFLSEDLLKNLRIKIVNHINKFIEPIIKKTYDIHTISNYHKHVTNEEHLKIVGSIYKAAAGKGIKTSDIDFDFKQIEDRITDICNSPDPLICKMPKNIHREFYVRLVRPTSKLDANPPHRDVWIDRLKNAVNLHFIVAGNSNKSTLAVLPGSHKLNENEIFRTTQGAQINGLEYQVPSVIDTKKVSMNFIRPRIMDNDVMVFSPYVIHGGGPNFSDKTRVSLEMRFWKV